MPNRLPAKVNEGWAVIHTDSGRKLILSLNNSSINNGAGINYIQINQVSVDSLIHSLKPKVTYKFLPSLGHMPGPG